MAVWGTLFAQVVLAFMVGLCGAVAQPSFDAMTQRHIPLSAQGGPSPASVCVSSWSGSSAR